MRLSKKFKSLIVITIIIVLLTGSGIVAKKIFLQQIKKRIHASFEFTQLSLSLFPPALVIEEVRSKSLSPFFSAKKISVSISYRSLLTRDKPLNVVVESPVISISSPAVDKKGKEKTELSFGLPFAVKEGLIKGAEFHYASQMFRMDSKGVNALYARDKDKFEVQAEALENTFSLGSDSRPISGKLDVLIEGQGKKIRIKKIEFNGPDIDWKAEGNLLQPLDPELEMSGSFHIQTGLIADMFNLPFDWEGEAEGEARVTRVKKEMTYSAGFLSRNLVLNRVNMGEVKGKVNFSEKEGGVLDLNIQKNKSPLESVRIHFREDKLEGSAHRFHLEPIMNYVGLPWPISSPAWGNFSIDKGKLKADVEFRDNILGEKDSKFPLQGLVSIDWDGQDHFSFSSKRISSSFAQVEVKGKVVVGQNVDVSINGTVEDVKQARQFTSLVLLKDFEFPEIRGKGTADLRIFGDYEEPSVRMNFKLSPGGFDRFTVFAVEGQAEVKEEEFTGIFGIDDPLMKGRIDLSAKKEEVKAEIWLDQGYIESILPPLEVTIPLQGEISGHFQVDQFKEKVSLNGHFSSHLMNLINQSLTDVDGKLHWEENSFSLSELQFGFQGGEVRGSIIFLPLSREFDIDVQGKKLNLASLYPKLEGELAFKVKGKGEFDQDIAQGDFEIKGLVFHPFQKTDARGEVKIGFHEDLLNIKLNGNFFPGENDFHVTLDVPFAGNSISGEVRGAFTNFDLFMPWKGAEGRINYLAELKDLGGTPQVKGAIDFHGPIFPFPRFAHAVRDYSGLIFFENSDLSLRSFKGKFGSGDIQGSGSLRLGNGSVDKINLRVEGKNLVLSPLERTRAYGDGALNLIKDTSRFVLEGDFFVRQLIWRREINEKFVFYSTPYYQMESEPGFFDDLILNIRLKADDNAWMENSLGRIRGKFDLRITGHVALPIVLGDIEAIDGEVYFQDRKFKILRGRVSFVNPSVIEPYLSFIGETYVKDYRVRFSLSGLLDKLNPEFSSSPPLPPEDVLALLAMGEAFKRTYQYDRSTQLSTASLLSFQISEEAKKRASSLFVLDRFRIDPFIMGSSTEMTARLTLGKKITRNFFVLYSTNLTSQREEITRIEWELTSDLSVVSIRDENGRVSIDVKIHKRF